jgi:hypothetical protein
MNVTVLWVGAHAHDKSGQVEQKTVARFGPAEPPRPRP